MYLRVSMKLVVLRTGKCQGITIIPFSAGHTIGGTIWKIRSPSVGTIVYAVNMNHMKERHLDGTVLFRPSAGGIFEPLARPDLFITDADRADVTTPRRKDRDAALIGVLIHRASYTRLNVHIRYNQCHAIFSFVVVVAMRCWSSPVGASCASRPALEIR